MITISQTISDNKINLFKNLIFTSAYFGSCDSSGNPIGSNTNDDPTAIFACKFTCPGSGSQTVLDVASYGKTTGGTSTQRMAIYDSTGATLIAQSNTVTTSSITEDWITYALSATLTGGTVYQIALTFTGSGYTSTKYNTALSGNTGWIASDYTSGFPTPLPTLTYAGGMYPVRVRLQGDAIDTGNKISINNFNSLLNGLVGYWTMQENGGTVLNDSSPSGINGALNGSYTWAPSYIQFSGAGYANVGKPAVLNISHTGSISIWYSGAGGSWMTILGTYDLDTDTNGYCLYVDNGNSPLGRVGLALSNATSYNAALTAASASDGNWHHIVGTWDGTNAKIYIDGNLSNTISQTLDPSVGVNNFNIGRNSAGSDTYFTGRVKYARVYNRALTAPEISSIYSLGA